MAQGLGFWYSPKSNKAIEVSRHEIDIKNPNFQSALELHPAAVSSIGKLPATGKNEDAIKTIAVRAGQVRARDWQKFTTVQLFGTGNRLKDIVFSLVELIDGYKNKTDEFNALTKQTKAFAKLLSVSWKLKIDNLATGASESISPKELMDQYNDDDFLEEKDDEMERQIKDIPLSGELIKEAEAHLREHGFFKEEDMDLLFESNCVRYSLDKHKTVINEEKLSRIWQLANKSDYVWGIITGYRGDADDKTNVSQNNKLKKDIRDQGYGFWELDGRWKETDAQGKKQDVGERSLFVAAPRGTDGNEFLDFMIEMTQKYDQDASVYKNDPSADADVMLYQYKTEEDGKRVVDEDHFSIGKFNPNKVGDAYSKILGTDRTFVFESITDSFILDEWSGE